MHSSQYLSSIRIFISTLAKKESKLRVDRLVWQETKLPEPKRLLIDKEVSKKKG